MSVIVSLLLTVRRCERSRAALQCEVRAVPHQLQVPERSRPWGLRLRQADRLFWVWFSRAWTEWRAALVIVTPHAVVASGMVVASTCSVDQEVTRIVSANYARAHKLLVHRTR